MWDHCREKGPNAYKISSTSNRNVMLVWLIKNPVSYNSMTDSLIITV